MTKIVKVNNWKELQDALFHDSWAPGIQRFRSSYVYRGLEDYQYNLSTSLNRQGETGIEKHLLRNFIKYSQLNEASSIWKWLAIAQHHGLPTRLLDWTYSPLVALHFATSDYTQFEKDGIIWAVNYVESGSYLPEKLMKVLRLEGSYNFTAGMLDQVVDTIPKLNNISAEAFAVFLEPPSIDDRIVNQYAVFSMMSDPNVLIDDWIISKKISHFKILIPAKLKWEIRDKLDQSNINERVLFPGLDGLATWLKRHYKDVRD